jgi:hypothetical protein
MAASEERLQPEPGRGVERAGETTENASLTLVRRLWFTACFSVLGVLALLVVASLLAWFFTGELARAGDVALILLALTPGLTVAATLAAAVPSKRSWAGACRASCAVIGVVSAVVSIGMVAPHLRATPPLSPQEKCLEDAKSAAGRVARNLGAGEANDNLRDPSPRTADSEEGPDKQRRSGKRRPGVRLQAASVGDHAAGGASATAHARVTFAIACTTSRRTRATSCRLHR